MILMEFTDGSSITHFVGRKSAFECDGDFLDKCIREYDWKIDELELDLRIEYVQDGVYCRFYPNMPQEMAYLDLESGYTFCDKGRGAFEVYVIDIRSIQGKENQDEV